MSLGGFAGSLGLPHRLCQGLNFVIVPSPSSGAVEKQLHVAAQVIDAGRGDLGVARRLGENERALQHGLGVESEAAGGPRGLMPCFSIASAISASTFAAWLVIERAQASRMAGLLS